MQEFKRGVGILLVMTIGAGVYLLVGDATPEGAEQAQASATPQEIADTIETTIAQTGQELQAVPTWDSQLDDQVLLEDFSQAYRQASQNQDRVTEYRILQELYAKKWSEVILEYLVEHALHLRRFDDAVDYMSTLQERGRLLDVVPARTFIQTLFNASELNVRNISNIKALVHEYYEQGELTREERSLYFGLVAFSKGDVDNYGYFMEQLTGDYQDWKQRYERIKETVFSYTEPPPYYLDGLIALDLFKRGYYQLARLSADRILRKAPSYVLPHQLIAYASLYTRQRGEAITHLQELKELDEPNGQLYTFLQGVAMYHNGQLAESVLQFDAIDADAYQTDALRYKLLAYAQMEDIERFERVAIELLQQDNLTPYDFFTTFDQLLYQPTGSSGVNQFAIALPTLLGRYLDACYEQISNQHGYICMYGQAGIYRIEGKQLRAYRFLQQLVRWYPRKVVYNQLGDLAFALGMEKDAKRRYIKGVLATGDRSLQDNLPERVQKILKN